MMTFPFKKRIKDELFIDVMLALYAERADKERTAI